MEHITLDRETELATLYEIATIPKRLHGLDAIVDLAVDKAFRLLSSDIVIFYLYNAQDNRMIARASRGVHLTRVCSEIDMDGKDTTTMKNIRTWQAPLPYNFPTNPLPDNYPIRASLGIPIQSSETLLGWLYVARVKVQSYSRSEISLYNVLANQVANTLEITVAWEQNRRQQEIMAATNQQLRRALAEIEQRTVKLIRTTNEAQEARFAAESANRAKSVFLANVSHELRTPLNAILGFAQLLIRGHGLTPEQQEHLAIINRSGEHLLNLINDVLELSKIEAGRVKLYEQSFGLHHLLNDLADLFHLRAMEKGLHLLFERAPDVPNYIKADGSKLRQVLINLLSNAIKFTPEGGVTLRVRCKSTTHDQYKLHFEIEDSGVGIATEELDKLFENFVQTRSGQQAQEGTGLGLPISRQFVRLMGGEIAVHSEVGVGSLFAFDIPVQHADSIDVPAQQTGRRVTGLAHGQPEYRILVVEDDWTNRMLLARLLQSVGFSVREAVNGAEGVEIWEQWQPHVIWMDMRMPVMDGYEATKQINARDVQQKTVIIALTASAFEEQRKIVLSLGCKDFVRKPYQQSLIFEKLEEHLHVRFAYEDSAEFETQPEEEHANQPTNSNMADVLSDVPVTLVAELYEAAAQADIDMVFQHIETLRQYSAELADQLEDMAEAFRLDQIVAMLDAKMTHDT